MMVHTFFFDGDDDDENTSTDDLNMVETGDYSLGDDIGGMIGEDDSSEEAL